MVSHTWTLATYRSGRLTPSRATSALLSRASNELSSAWSSGYDLAVAAMTGVVDIDIDAESMGLPDAAVVSVASTLTMISLVLVTGISPELPAEPSPEPSAEADPLAVASMLPPVEHPYEAADGLRLEGAELPPVKGGDKGEEGAEVGVIADESGSGVGTQVRVAI